MGILTSIQIIIFILSFSFQFNTLNCSNSNTKRLACPLIWAAISNDGSPPENAITTNGQQSDFPARSTLDDPSSNPTFKIGRYDSNLRKVLIPSQGIVKQSFDFQVLTNPHGCTTKWTLGYENNQEITEFGVKSDNGLIYIGRTFINSQALSGSIDLQQEKMEIALNENISSSFPSRESEFLISYSKGILIELVDLKFSLDPSSAGQMDLVGMDIINNEAPTNVSYTVSHRKEISSQITLTEGTTCQSSWLFSVGAGLKVPGLGGIYVEVGMGMEGSLDSSKSITTEITTTVELSRTITVNPYQSVEICSTVSVTNPNFETEFEATAKYTALGWTGEEIVEYLRNKQDWNDLQVSDSPDDNAALKTVKGKVKGGLGIKGFTRVIPKGGAGSCFEIQNEVIKRNQEEFKLRRDKRIRRATAEAALFKTPKPKIEFEYATANDIKFTLFYNSNSNDSLELGNYDSIGQAKFKNGPFTFITHGFTSEIGSPEKGFAEKIINANPNSNVILIDWKKLANPLDISLVYSLAAGNTLLVGTATAQLILMLKERNVIKSLDDVHLIGHSLGSHAIGFTGSTLFGQVGKITALDPAGPIFDTVCDGTRIDKSDAKFVVAIHTDGGINFDGLGFLEPRGHVDFYPNGGIQQPNCFDECFSAPSWICDLFAAIIGIGVSPGGISSCSHGRVWELIDSSMRTDIDFKGTFCDSWNNYINGQCDSNEMAIMSFNTPKTTKHGNYYFNTTGEEPWMLPETCDLDKESQTKTNYCADNKYPLVGETDLHNGYKKFDVHAYKNSDWSLIYTTYWKIETSSAVLTKHKIPTTLMDIPETRLDFVTGFCKCQMPLCKDPKNECGLYNDLFPPVSKAYSIAGQIESFKSQEFQKNENFAEKGHLVPNADFSTENERRATHLYINGVPQWEKVNRGNWFKIEDYIRKHLNKIYTVYAVIMKPFMRKMNENEKTITISKNKFSENNWNKIEIPGQLAKIVTGDGCANTYLVENDEETEVEFDDTCKNTSPGLELNTAKENGRTQCFVGVHPKVLEVVEKIDLEIYNTLIASDFKKSCFPITIRKL